MKYYGYTGKILHINLTTGGVKTEPLDPDIARSFIGDFGVGARLAYDLIPPGTDPLSPENAIIISTSPLTGVPFPVTRSSIFTKYPASGAIAFGNCGMKLGKKVKAAGYDHIVITGKAAKPVYLKIFSENITTSDAGALWGRDIADTTDELSGEHGNSCSVLAIGQAGENLVSISLALVDKLSTVGRGGLGAVMGAKNLKAVVVDGNQPTTIADRERFRKAADPLLKTFRDDPLRPDWRAKGKYRLEDSAIRRGLDIRNHRALSPTEKSLAEFGVQAFLTRLKRKSVGCPGCPYPCKDILEIRDGEYKGLTTYAPCFMGHARQGTRCGITTMEELTFLADRFNRYGVSFMLFSDVMGLAVELFEKGIITLEDTGGIMLDYDFSTTSDLLHKVAFREGIGDTLADGFNGISRRFGRECLKYSNATKGTNTQHDGRAMQLTMSAFGDFVNPEGGASEPAHAMDLRVTRELGIAKEETSAGYASFHEPYSQQRVINYCRKIGIPDEAMGRVLYEPLGYNVGRITRYAQDFYTILTCLGICEYRTGFFDWPKFAEFYSSVTGIELTPADMQQAADRIWNIFKALNVREGFTRKDDEPPPRLLEPIKTPSGEEKPLLDCRGEPLTPEGVARLLDDYYEERGWDVPRGIPTRQKLAELGLADIAADLAQRGVL